MKNILHSLVIAVFCYVIGYAQPVSTPSSTNDTTMKTVTSGKFTFAYKIEGENLVANLSFPSTGWISIGFNPKMVMDKAFFVTGAVVDGKPVVREDFGTGMFSHSPITGLGGKNVLIASDCTTGNGVTTLSFTMPLSTKDGMHADLAVGKKVKLIFAAGKSSDMTKKHNAKGSKTTVL